ncbi:MAG: branched-chain amino acid ABC transporter substrate-binding protein [Coriobacteriia bacterium]|nr:branched-chain amino acid ABC transporter substrate-binding protein [Coriobacteriia bacterium]
MKARKLRFFLAVVALVAISLLAVGCGSKGATTSGSSKSTTLTIGVGAPLTQGSVAIGEGIVRGVKLAVSKMNASADAKSLDITFKAAEGDDQGDPKTGVTAANTFASDRSIIGVVGHYNSGVTIPSSKVYNDNRIVMVSPGATSPTVTAQGYDVVFRTCATDALQGPAGADRLYALGKRKVVVVDDSTTYGEGLSAAFAAEWKKIGGTILLTAKTQDKDTDFNALVTKAKALNPDLVYYAGLYNAGALLTKQMKDAGLNVPVLGGDGLYDPEYINLGGKGTEGDYTTCVGLPAAMLPSADVFKKDYIAMFPGQTIGAFDAYAYDAATAIMTAAINVAKTDGASTITTPAGREKLIKGVAAVQFEGVTGPIAFDAKGDTKNKVVTLYKVVGGKWAPQEKK